MLTTIKHRLATNYYLWKLYHFLVTDANSMLWITSAGIVLRYLGRSPGVVCDIGCGAGMYTRYLAKHAEKVVCIDVPGSGLIRVKARHNKKNNVTFCYSYLEGRNSLPFPDGTFDTILLLQVLEHIKDDLEALMEIRRLLRPGGRLVCSVPVPPGYIDDEVANPYGHKREGYTLSDLKALIASAGLKLTDYEYCWLTFSRLVLKAYEWFVAHFKIKPPSPFQLPMYLDLVLKDKEKHLPYMLVSKAVR